MSDTLASGPAPPWWANVPKPLRGGTGEYQPPGYPTTVSFGVPTRFVPGPLNSGRLNQALDELQGQLSVLGLNIAAGDTAPTDPAPNTLWFDSVGCQLYVWYDDGTSAQWVPATSLSALNAAYLALTGGTMTGPLTLAGNALLPLQPVPLQQLDTYLPLSGGTLTGPLTLAGEPTVALHPATKNYVDTTALPLAGGTLTGPLSVSPAYPAFNVLQASSVEIGPGSYASNVGPYVSFSEAAGRRDASNNLVNTWVGQSPFMGWFDQYARVAAFHTGSGPALAVATRKNADGSGGANPAMAAYTRIDGSGANPVGGGWAYYGAGVRFGTVPANQGSMLNEFDMANLGDTVRAIPYQMGNPGTTATVWLATGGEIATDATYDGQYQPISCYIGMLSNNARQDPGCRAARGIVFGQYSLAGTDGVTPGGRGIALNLAAQHEMTWHYGVSEHRASFLRCDATTESLGVLVGSGKLSFVDAALAVYDPANAEKEYFAFAKSGPVATVGHNTATAPTFALNGAAATIRGFFVSTAGLPRWRFGAGSVAEGGANVGSDFAINRYNDAGTTLGPVLTLTRSTGAAAFAGDLTATGNLAAAGGSFSGVLTGQSLTVNAGPTIRAGTGAATGTQPAGSLWMRTDGATGTRIYVSAGAGTWAPIAGV